ncbi:ATPase, partial [Actinoplanes sp. NPDC024001]
MDGTETGWGRPAEPAPRWRALLDRARHGSRSEEPEPAQPEPEQPQPQQWGQQQPAAGRGAAPVERRPYNPLDPRSAERRGAEPPAEPRPMPQRPINPLDPRWQSRREPEQQQNSFFEPAPRSAQPPAPREYGAGAGYAAPAREYPPNGYAPGAGYAQPVNGYAPAPAPAYPPPAAPAPAYPPAPAVARTPA